MGGGLGIGGSAFNRKIEEVEEIVTSRDFFRELLTSNPEILNNILYARFIQQGITKDIRLPSGSAPATEDVIEKRHSFSRLTKIFLMLIHNFLRVLNLSKH